MSLKGAGEEIRKAVTKWDGIEVAAHRFGGLEYRIGRREIGHMHGDSLVDIPFPKRVRDELVAAGVAQPHHVLPETGWVTFYIREHSDIMQAIALFRRSYELALRQRGS